MDKEFYECQFHFLINSSKEILKEIIKDCFKLIIGSLCFGLLSCMAIGDYIGNILEKKEK